MAQARSRARERGDAARQALWPLGWAFIAIVVTASVQAHPLPGLRGAGLGVTLALAVYAAAVATAVTPGWARRGLAAQAVVIGLIGGAGVALAAVQPHGPVELAAPVGVWIAAVRLPPAPAAAAAGMITAALAVAVGLTEQPPVQSAITATLVCLLLAVTGQFIRRGRQSQDRTELLMAQLQDAREGEAAAAALAERSRIAGELHDVLAHSLSGLAIQLQGARKLAGREQVSEGLRATIERSAELARAGLADARQAVGALRGGRLPTVDQLNALVEGFRRDTGTAATVRIDGTPRPLPADASLALFRGAQEALTNIARYAPGATTSVTVSYQAGRTRVTVEDHARPCSCQSRPGRGARICPARRGGRRARPDGDARASPAGRRHRPGRADRRRVAGRAGGARVTAVPEPGTIRVLIADDQRVVREGLSMLVGLIDGVEVVGTACDGAEAVRLAQDRRPDVVLMDLRMPGTDGIAATADLRERLPAARVLVLTTYADQDAIVPALQAGARGYLTKDASAEQIETAIRAVHAGQTHLDPAVQETPRGRGHQPPAVRGPIRPGPRTARWAHRPRGRGAHPPRIGAEQHRDRPAPLPHQRDGQDPHQPDLRQDRSPRPCPGRPVRLPAPPRSRLTSTWLDPMRAQILTGRCC